MRPADAWCRRSSKPLGIDTERFVAADPDIAWVVVLFRRLSPLTGDVNEKTLRVRRADLAEYIAARAGRAPRRHIQDVFPYLGPAEREFILTGHTPEDWRAMFGDGDA